MLAKEQPYIQKRSEEKIPNEKDITNVRCITTGCLGLLSSNLHLKNRKDESAIHNVAKSFSKENLNFMIHFLFLQSVLDRKYRKILFKL